MVKTLVLGLAALAVASCAVTVAPSYTLTSGTAGTTGSGGMATRSSTSTSSTNTSSTSTSSTSPSGSGGGCASVELIVDGGAGNMGNGFDGTLGFEIVPTMDVDVSAMSLEAVTLPSAQMVGARIYDVVTLMPIATGEAPTDQGMIQTIPVMISASLMAGHRYWAAFYVSGGSATLYSVPTMSYVVAPFTVIGFGAATDDNCPQNTNFTGAVPQITIETCGP
jgi:hypothetical protein